MGLLKKFLSSVGMKKQKKDIETIINTLKELDSYELSDVYYFVSRSEDIINERMDIDVSDPFEALKKCPDIAIRIFTFIRSSQNVNLNSGMTIWLFTIRAAMHPEIFHLGKEMWKELSRCDDSGFSFPKGF